MDVFSLDVIPLFRPPAEADDIIILAAKDKMERYMIEQKNIPLVSLESMNETHFEEVEIINELLNQLDSNADFDSISKSLQKLLEHMHQHFSSEEKLMKETHYPSLNMHKADHNKVLNEARYTEMQWRNKKDAQTLKYYMVEDILPWLDQHIKAMDMPMADFISQHNEHS